MLCSIRSPPCPAHAPRPACHDGPRRVPAQGLLAETLQPLLQTRAGRERAQAALLDAGAALEAAQRIVQGAGPAAGRARHCSVHAQMHCGRTARTRQQARFIPRGLNGG